MNAQVEQGTCQWRQHEPCQFTELPTYIHNGIELCAAHLPLAAPEKASHDLHRLMQIRLQAGQLDFSGIILGGGGVYELNRTGMRFRGATFGDGARLLVAGDADFTEAHFLGTSVIELASATLSFKRAKFTGKVLMRGNMNRPRIDLSGAQFGDEVRLHEVQLENPFVAAASIFRGPLIFDQCTLPQQSSFNGARFRRGATPFHAEGYYRSTRNMFAEHRNRELEGLFYGLEKRSHRRSLRWFSAARWLSAIYDWTAGYGQSFERAALSFILIQCVFGLLYSAMSGRLRVPGPVDVPVVAFTLSQVGKPFELLSGRKPDGIVAEVVGSAGANGTWLLVTFLHGVLSLALVALFILALRWRFKRE